MFCKNCGTQLEANAGFCSNCGSAVEKEEQVNVQTSVDSSVDSTQTVNTTVDSGASFAQPVNTTVDSNVGGSSNQNRTNNNLKNALIILLVCLILGGGAALAYFTLFGKDDAKVIESAMNNMVDVDSMSFNMNADMQMEVEGQTADVTIGFDADIDIKNKLASMNVLAKASGVSFEIPVYLDMTSGSETIYIQNPTANQWAKMSLSGLLGENLPITDTEEENVKFVIEDYLKNDEFIEKIKNDDKNIIQYRLHFTKEILEKMAEEEGSSEFDMETIKEAGLEDGFDLDLYINKKENYITKISMDLSGRTISDQKVNKFVMTFEITDLNKVESIVIPSEAKSAQELDLSSLMGGVTTPDVTIPDVTVPDVTIPEDDTYVEDYKLTDYDYVISYNLPAGYEASSVNDESFKIYRKDGMRVIMSIDWDTKTEFFEYVASEKESYVTNGYTNVTLSEIKELVHNDKTFYYQVIEYTDKYGNNNYEAYLCYELDSEYVYSVTYEDEDNVGSVTETSMKDFLDITVTNVAVN